MQFESVKKETSGANKNIYKHSWGKFVFNSQIIKDFWSLAKKGKIVEAFLVDVLFYHEIENRYYLKESKNSQNLIINVNKFEDLAILGIPTLAMWNGEMPYNLDFNIDIEQKVRPWLLGGSNKFECLDQEGLDERLLVFSHPGDSEAKINLLRYLIFQRESIEKIPASESEGLILSQIKNLAYNLADECSQKCVSLEKDSFFVYFDKANFYVPAVGIGDVDFVQIFDSDDEGVKATMPTLLHKTNRRAVDIYISALRNGLKSS